MSGTTKCFYHEKSHNTGVQHETIEFRQEECLVLSCIASKNNPCSSVNKPFTTVGHTSYNSIQCLADTVKHVSLDLIRAPAHFLLQEARDCSCVLQSCGTCRLPKYSCRSLIQTPIICTFQHFSLSCLLFYNFLPPGHRIISNMAHALHKGQEIDNPHPLWVIFIPVTDRMTSSVIGTFIEMLNGSPSGHTWFTLTRSLLKICRTPHGTKHAVDPCVFLPICSLYFRS